MSVWECACDAMTNDCLLHTYLNNGSMNVSDWWISAFRELVRYPVPELQSGAPCFLLPGVPGVPAPHTRYSQPAPDAAGIEGPVVHTAGPAVHCC